MLNKTEIKSKYCKNASPVYVSDNMSGKMLGIPSISTNSVCNERCKAHKDIDGCICQKCFAEGVIGRYSALREHLTDNSNLLSSSVLPLEDLPRFANVLFVRLESFGDLINVNHAMNYLNICFVNPRQTFTIWTKNPDILDKAISMVGKPANLICIVSSYMLNDSGSGYRFMERYDWIDKVFTVYTPKYIEEHNVTINCGSRDCMNCQRCYDQNDKEIFINERLK